jgi:hypothetical protein
MKKLLVLIGLLLASPAFAVDNTVIVTPGTGVTMKSKDIGSGVQAMQPILSDTGGLPLSTPTAGADAASNTLTGLLSYNRNLVFNGTTWDRWQGTVNLGTIGTAATAANQTTINTSIGTTNTNLGAQADTAAAADTSTASLIALLKRTNQNLTTVNTTASAPTPACAAAPCVTTVGDVGVDVSSGKGTPSSAAINVSTATTTQLVAISGSTKIYVTSYDVMAGGTGNITFEYGTGASCGTGTTALTGAYPLTAQAGISKGSGVGAVLIVPAGNALCVLTSAAVQMSGSVSYQQF